MELITAIRELVADALGIDLSEVPANGSMESIADWDSLQHLGVINAIEAEYDLSVDPDEIAALHSIAAIASFVQTYLKSGYTSQ